MAIEKVKEYFERYGLKDRVLEFDTSSATVSLAAVAAGCKEGEIAKTMAFMLPDGPVLIVMAGDTKVDNRLFKQTFGVKAQMLKGDDVLKYTGHQAGGVCPFANPEGTRVYLDTALKRFEYVYPACGSSNSAIRLSLSELEKYSACLSWVTISKEIEELPSV